MSRVGFLRPLGHGISLEEVGMGINYSMGIPLLHLVLSPFPKKVVYRGGEGVRALIGKRRKFTKSLLSQRFVWSFFTCG